MPRCRTAITHIRSVLNLSALFLLKAGTDVVAFEAGATVSVTDNDFAASIHLFTVIAMDAEVMGIVKAPAMEGVYDPMIPDLFRDSRGIFAEVLGNLTERFLFIKGFFDVLPILECQVFMVSRYQFRHINLLYRHRVNSKENSARIGLITIAL